MTSIDCVVTNYIRGANPVWSFVDLVGRQFDDTFYLWVLENQVPYIPATVYHDPSGTIPWSNPIQFLANGTLPVDIFFANHTLYRLEIRQAVGTNPPSQSDPLIYLIENYNPSQAVDGDDTVEGDATENQVTNAQFSLINFQSPLVLTGLVNPDPIEIAPGWEFVGTGNGSVTFEQVPLNNVLNNPTNAPYALKIITSGWTNQPYIRQRFQQNGMNWANKTVSASLTALMTGGPQFVQLTLNASDGTQLALLISTTLTNSFAQYQGFFSLLTSTNADLPPDAWLELRLLLPTNAETYVSSLQIVASDAQVNVPYEQDTIDRQIDHTFHYYKPQLEYKPIPSYLIGWDFAYNPAQIFGDTRAAQAIGANKSEYKWDQTIVFQSANSGVATSRDATTNGLKLTANGACKMAVIQYLEMQQARELLQGDMSVFIEGLASANYTGTISLWATDDANLPDVDAGTNDSLVSAIDATGRPTCANGAWTEITRQNLGNISFDLSTTLNGQAFSGWNLDTSALVGTATFMAIVIAFEEIANNDYVILTDIALCKGKIATHSAPKTQAQTLLECQRFYWKSFAQGTAPATAILIGIYSFNATSGGADNLLSIQLPTTMRGTSPVTTIYSPVNGTNRVRNTTVNFDAPTTATIDAANKVLLIAVDNSGGGVGNYLAGNFTADARLGVVN